MRAAVTDKFESDDMDIHRNHILGWMKELWNKWRGQLHAKYVKGKPIQEALKNVPKGVDKKQWEWLVKEYFSTESFQAQIKELVQSEPPLPSIKIVEKYFGPQSRSHVFGFGGGLKAKDLKGETSSKDELLAKLRSTQNENQSLKDRLSNFENEMKELKQLFLAQQPPVQENDYSDP
ncbi:uncharacterized protein [Nicotiana tomentosiformis]|uniref:uncharacterized protein isoform X3 n=1 Tax=Nicotiana tomentosiformis TaxID=4098 RepID=UPI0014480E2E|nr:uncharacterized protein LOC104099967 isoform X3 [Nicotiana tomentosiformis]